MQKGYHGDLSIPDSTTNPVVTGSNISIPAVFNTTCCNCPNIDTSGNKDKDYSYDAFLYIIVVLSFYAMSMVLLMMKYIRREEEEMSLDFYYMEFVKREKFQTANYRNTQALQKAQSSGVLKKAFSLGNCVRFENYSFTEMCEIENERMLRHSDTKTAATANDNRNVPKTLNLSVVVPIDENIKNNAKISDTEV